MRYTEQAAAQLPELDPIEVTLAHVKTGSGQYGPYVIIDWQLPDQYGGGTVGDVLGISVNINPQNGRPAKLRTALNAIAGRPDNTRIKWFDDGLDDQGKVVGPPAWSYDGTRADCALTEGLPVIIRGKLMPRSDGQGDQWRVQHYQPVRQAPPPARQQPTQRQTDVPQAAPEDVNPDEGWDPDAVPF